MGKIHIFLLVLVSGNAPEHVKDALEVHFSIEETILFHRTPLEVFPPTPL